MDIIEELNENYKKQQEDKQKLLDITLKMAMAKVVEIQKAIKEGKDFNNQFSLGELALTEEEAQALKKYWINENPLSALRFRENAVHLNKEGDIDYDGVDDVLLVKLADGKFLCLKSSDGIRYGHGDFEDYKSSQYRITIESDDYSLPTYGDDYNVELTYSELTNPDSDRLELPKTEFEIERVFQNEDLNIDEIKKEQEKIMQEQERQTEEIIKTKLIGIKSAMENYLNPGPMLELTEDEIELLMRKEHTESALGYVENEGEINREGDEVSNGTASILILKLSNDKFLKLKQRKGIEYNEYISDRSYNEYSSEIIPNPELPEKFLYVFASENEGELKIPEKILDVENLFSNPEKVDVEPDLSSSQEGAYDELSTEELEKLLEKTNNDNDDKKKQIEELEENRRQEILKQLHDAIEEGKELDKQIAEKKKNRGEL